MQLINNQRVLRTFDKDTINFIDAAGLDNDANLNVAGLYNAEQARMAVHILVSGMKSIKDVGQSQNIWDRSKAIGMLHPIIGGNASQHALNLLNPDTHLITFGTSISGTPIHNGYGWQFGFGTTDLLHDITFNNNINFIITQNLQSNPSVASQIDIASFYNGTDVTNNGASFAVVHASNLLAFRALSGTSQTFSNINKILGTFSSSYNGNNVFWAINGENGNPIQSSFSSVLIGTPNSFRYGEVSPSISNSWSRKSMLGVLPFITSFELRKITRLIEIYQAQLNRRI